MPEDAGKKRYIKDFLQEVKGGEDFIEDIWIERVLRLPGTSGEGSTAKSISGRGISNITELLEDDLKHTFDDGYFTFRFVAALLGSGKTSLLTYLHELTKNKSTYSKLSVVVNFPLSKLLTIPGVESFSIKFYCYILTQTFWELLHNNNLSSPIRSVAEDILKDLLRSPSDPVAQLKSATDFETQFAPKFNKYLVESGVGFESFFFHTLAKISAIEPLFTFVYLTDELDSLQHYPNYIQDTRALFRALIKKVRQEFKSKIRLLMYLVGTSDNVESFIAGDSVLESLIEGSSINLNAGYNKEFETIRVKIDKRIEGAYKGYKNFDKAWEKIQNIPLKPAKNLRNFCREYASTVLEIHEYYFSEVPEQAFEGNARQLLEAQCRQKWENYLKSKSYRLSNSLTTKVIKGHAFDCYVELLHNNIVVARAFGEAKNYELLREHLQTFEEWLKDADFKPTTLDVRVPPDLAFMFAPECPSLLKRKLEIKNIQFIKSDKVPNPIYINNSTKKDEMPESVQISDVVIQEKNEPKPTVININTANKATLTQVFKGTRVQQTTIDKLMNYRPHASLDAMISKVKFGNPDIVKKQLQQKLDKGEICFSI